MNARLKTLSMLELELKTTVRKLMKDTCKKTAFVFDNEIYKHLVFLFINSNK